MKNYKKKTVSVTKTNMMRIQWTLIFLLDKLIMYRKQLNLIRKVCNRNKQKLKLLGVN